MKPILFNTEMVRAILDGRKTQTRRALKPQPIKYTGRNFIFADDECPKKWEQCDDFISTAPYHTGDILWVRETWKKVCATERYYECGKCVDSEELFGYMYRADNLIRWDERKPKDDEFHLSDITRELNWHPSIHMPREAARILLRVTDVRVERLQDMTEDDAFAEGHKGCPAEHTRYFPEGGAEPCSNLGECPFQFWYCQHSDPEGFGRDIWDKTIKPADLDCYGWDANPWVWVISFDRYDPADPAGGADNG